MSMDELTFARHIDSDVYWLGGCLVAFSPGQEIHYHVSTYLIVGQDATVLVDTGDPAHADLVMEQLQSILGARTLDYVFPTHPEIPHAGNLPRLLEHYPGAQIVGDVRDYALHYPEYSDRLVAMKPGDRLKLGGRDLVMMPAHIRDLENTLWAYDTGSGALFVSDGFSFIHDVPQLPEDDEPTHLPGQCRLFSGEMPEAPTVEQAAYGTGRALYWTKFVDVTSAFASIEKMLADYPTKFICPAHGSVIDDVDEMVRTSFAAHRAVYEAARSEQRR